MVTALGSSVLPIGAGSTYLRTVMSRQILLGAVRWEIGILGGICTSFLVDLHLHVEVDSENDDVADHVERAHTVQDVRVFEGDFLARLHHHEDDDEVGAISWSVYYACLIRSWSRATENEHLRIHGGGISSRVRCEVEVFVVSRTGEVFEDDIDCLVKEVGEHKKCEETAGSRAAMSPLFSEDNAWRLS